MRLLKRAPVLSFVRGCDHAGAAVSANQVSAETKLSITPSRIIEVELPRALAPTNAPRIRICSALTSLDMAFKPFTPMLRVVGVQQIRGAGL
jgi:hypothetical protein